MILHVDATSAVPPYEQIREQPQQRGLARAVDADDRHALAWAQSPGELVQHLAAVVRERDLDSVQYAVAETRAREA